MYGPHITILVLSVVPHLNSMVYSKVTDQGLSGF